MAHCDYRKNFIIIECRHTTQSDYMQFARLCLILRDCHCLKKRHFRHPGKIRSKKSGAWRKMKRQNLVKNEERRERTRIDFMVELRGIEPRTSCMPCKRSPSWAITPNAANDTWCGEKCQIFWVCEFGQDAICRTRAGENAERKYYKHIESSFDEKWDLR